MGRWGKVEQTPSVTLQCWALQALLRNSSKRRSQRGCQLPASPATQVEGYQPGSAPAAHRPLRPSYRGLPEFLTPEQHARDGARTSPARRDSPSRRVHGGAGCPCGGSDVPRTAAETHPNPSFAATTALTRLPAIHNAALSFSPQQLPSPTRRLRGGPDKGSEAPREAEEAQRARPLPRHTQPLEVALHYSSTALPDAASGAIGSAGATAPRWNSAPRGTPQI